MEKYLEPTAMLNFNDEMFQHLIRQKGWDNLNYEDRIKQIYDFVRNEIKFGITEGMIYLLRKYCKTAMGNVIQKVHF